MKNNKVIKAGIWYTISNFLLKGLAFITMPLFTRIMTKSDIGLFSNITTWFSILTIIATFELYSSLSIAQFDFKNDLKSYISSNLILGTIITSIFYIIYLIFHNFIDSLISIDFLTMNIIFICLLFYPAVHMYQLKKQFDYSYKKVVLISILSAVSSTSFSIILVLIFKNKLLGRTLGYFIPQILISLIIYIILIKNGGKISKKYFKYALQISAPLIFHLLAGYLLNSADKVMITKMVSPEANALYSVSYSLSMIVSILWTSMNNAWSPWAYQQMEKKTYNNLKNYSKPYTLFFIFIVFLFMLITPELLLIVGGKSYMESMYVMPPVMIGYVFQFVYSLYVNIEFYNKKQKTIAIATIITSLTNIVLNYIFIKIFGYIAAAYTTLISYSLLFLIHYLNVKIKLKQDFMYDISFFIKIFTASLIYMYICLILYSFNLIRLIVISLIAIIIIIIIGKNFKEIKNAIKKKNINELLLIFKRKKEI